MEEETVGWTRRVREGVVRWLPERQIILRTDGETSYLRLTTGFQLSMVAVWIAFAGWVGFTAVGYYAQDSIIVAKSESIERSRHAYRKLLDQISDYQLSIVGITRDLQATETEMRRVFSQNKELKQDLTSTEVALRTSEAERQRIAEIRSSMGGQLEMLGSELRQIAGKNNALEAHIGTLRRHVEAVEAEKAEIAAERAALDDRLWSLHNDLEAANSRVALLENNVHALKTDLRSVILERSAIAADNDALRSEVSALQQNLDQAREAHREELRTIADRTLDNINTVEDVIRRTGLKLDEIAPLPEPMLTGQGGPFVPYHPDMEAQEDVDDLRMMLQRRLDRWDLLRDVFTSLPLLTPVEKYYVSSRYGRRKDPFNGRWAMHYGVDMAGPRKQAITATASGTVAFAGRRMRYGRVIDIDHGHGLVTRYAHLAKITVKKGQTVTLGDKIGFLGSSGRSTGPHVHYEIRYNGKPVNPVKFLKAGKHVQAKKDG